MKILLKKYILIIFIILIPFTLFAQASDSIQPTYWNLHFQQTFVEQYHPPFHADYSGKNSFNASKENELSMTSTLFLGLKLWKGAEIYFNPEVSGGSGLSKVQGIAGFPNNEVVRVGNIAPTFYPARFYIQQVINLDKPDVQITDDLNQFDSKVSSSRLAFHLGKFSILDFFDFNKYSHDGRNHFMNWALVSNGSWDYPADTRGYTIGFVAELIQPEYSVRFATAMVPTMVNGPDYDTKLNGANALVLELEKSYNFWNSSGIARLLFFRNVSNAGTYSTVINNPEYEMNITKSGKYGTMKYGFGVNIEQDINSNIGSFLRAGWNNGQTESWMFTEIDRSLSLGIVFNGNLWNRKEDVFGFASLLNGLSDEHKEYLEKGGYGFIIGDGKLNYGIESSLETYYQFTIIKAVELSLFYQFINNPAYNKDRGPVSIFSLRTHIEF